MKVVRRVSLIAAWAACCGFLIPQSAWAANPTDALPAFTDIALETGGVLTGTVVDAQGNSQAGSAVAILHDGQQVAATITNEQGEFRVARLRGGLHQVVAGEGSALYRFWSPETAPPAAAERAMIVADGTIQRNQYQSPIKRVIGNPWIVAGVVAAALAVPIAVNNNKKSGS
jgi:hypothetical protein